MPYDPKWEFPKDKLIMLEPIGKGAFGEVWLAKAQGILDFKAQVSSMSPIKKKRFSRMFSNHSGYDNADLLKNAELSKVAVKTLKGKAVIMFHDFSSCCCSNNSFAVMQWLSKWIDNTGVVSSIPPLMRKATGDPLLNPLP